MVYTGNSIVDYLKSIGQASDYASRANLATQQGIQNYQGTAEQNTQLLGILNKPVSPPTSGGTVEMNTSGSPAITPNSGAITASGAGASTAGTATIADLESRLNALSTQQPSTETQEVKKSWMDLITKRNETVENQKSAQELRSEALTQVYSEMGVTPEQIQKIGGLIGEVTEYNKQVADLEAKKQTAIDTIEERTGGTIDYANAEISKISKIYNSEIAAKAAQAGVKVQELQMIQGAYDDAKQTASQIVELATYDQQQAVADIEWSLGAYQDLYTTLTTEEQTAWDRQYTTAKDTLATLKAEKTAISEIMMTPELSGAGVTINDTLEQAQAKVSKYIGTSAYLNRIAQIGAAGRAPESNGVDTVGTSYYDAELQSLLEQNPNLSAGQLATLYVTNSGESLTEKEKTNILARAQVIVNQPKPKVFTNVPTPSMVPKQNASLSRLQQNTISGVQESGGSNSLTKSLQDSIYKSIFNFGELNKEGLF
jgi:hypothetical protein